MAGDRDQHDDKRMHDMPALEESSGAAGHVANLLSSLSRLVGDLMSLVTELRDLTRTSTIPDVLSVDSAARRLPWRFHYVMNLDKSGIKP